MGSGEQRSLTCLSEGSCSNGQPAIRQNLLAPKSLAAGADGSVYMADYDLIRRIQPDGTVDTLLKLK